MTEQILCKNQKVSIHDPRGAVWCNSPCMHYVIPTLESKCTCCLSPLPKNTIVTPPLKVFDQILQNNLDSILAYKANPTRDYEFFWAVRIGIQNFLVPVHYLVEYYNLQLMSASNLQLKTFLEKVKTECRILGRGFQVVK